MTKLSKSVKTFKPSLSKLRAVLKEVPFNPKTPGTMKIVADQGDSGYYLRAATVCIHDALNKVHVSKNILHAIRLLILAEVWRRK